MNFTWEGEAPAEPLFNFSQNYLRTAMNIFISWSGDRSHKVAQLFHDWIKCVLQSTSPWISSHDLDRGTVWFSDIFEKLNESSIGVFFITKENRDRPWILFEAGAIMKGLSKSRVCTFLVDLDPLDITGPLTNFNATLPNKDGVRSLVSTINNQMSNGKLEPNTLQKVFDKYWSEFEEQFTQIISSTPETTNIPPRDEKSIMQEVLTVVQQLNTRMSRLETNTSDVSSQEKRNLNQLRKELSEQLLEGRSPLYLYELYSVQYNSDRVAQIIRSIINEKIKNNDNRFDWKHILDQTHWMDV